MKIVCALCDKPMGEKEGGTPEDVTHGICKKCLRKLKDLGGIYILSSSQRLLEAEKLWEKDRWDNHLRLFLKRETSILLRLVLKAWWRIRFGRW